MVEFVLSYVIKLICFVCESFEYSGRVSSFENIYELYNVVKGKC